jgi:hypothetical protein
MGWSAIEEEENTDYSLQSLLALLGGGSQRRTFLGFRAHVLAG